MFQAFANCVHGYDCAHNVHANASHVYGIDWEHNLELLTACPHGLLSFKKIRTTTAAVFLISNTVVPNPYSHSTALDPQSFTLLS